MQVHTLRYSCEIFTTKTCYVENKNIRLSIEKMRKRRIAMLRMRMCCCRITGGGTSNRLFATGGFIIVPPSCTITSATSIFPFHLFFHHFFYPFFHPQFPSFSLPQFLTYFPLLYFILYVHIMLYYFHSSILALTVILPLLSIPHLLISYQLYLSQLNFHHINHLFYQY